MVASCFLRGIYIYIYSCAKKSVKVGFRVFMVL